MNTLYQLDQNAKRLAREFKKLESELIDVIMRLDRCKGFYQLGYPSLFAYVSEGLKLSPALTAQFIKVARKSQEVPELKEAVTAGTLSVSKAQKLVAVINPENKKKWLHVAQQTTHRQLEREVALASPKQATRERAKYIQPSSEVKERVTIKREVPRLELQLGVSEQLMLKIRRVQDLESQRQKKNLDLEATLEALVEVFLEKRDPVRKAQRQKARGKLLAAEKVNSSCVKSIEHSHHKEKKVSPKQESADDNSNSNTNTNTNTNTNSNFISKTHS